jgi:hypothetical protein
MVSRLVNPQARNKEIKKNRNEKKWKLNFANFNKGWMKLNTKSGYPIENGV